MRAGRPRTSRAASSRCEDPDGNEAVIEATTSWAYVGPGLRITLELLGPEYAMEFNSLSTGLKVFLSREVTGSAGEDLVEKQNAEQGLMPVLEDEPGIYGYTLREPALRRALPRPAECPTRPSPTAWRSSRC